MRCTMPASAHSAASRMAVSMLRALLAPWRDHTDAVDTEQHGTAEGIRIVLGDAGPRIGSSTSPTRASPTVEVQSLGREPQHRPHAALDGLEGHVAGEPVGDDDVGPAEGEVAALDVADEARQLREQVVGALAHLVALAHLLADRQQPDAGPVDAVVETGVLGAHPGELHQPLRGAVDGGAHVEQERRGGAAARGSA